MARKDGQIIQKNPNSAVNFKFLSDAESCFKLKNEILLVEDILNDEHENINFKNLLALIYKKNISIDESKKKEGITAFLLKSETLKNLETLEILRKTHWYMLRTVNFSSYTKPKYLILNQLWIFFKTELELKFLFLPEIFALKFHLLEWDLEFVGYKFKDYLSMLFSLKELNHVFSNVLKPMAPYFFLNADKRTLQRKFAVYVFFLREFFLVTFLQSLRIRDGFLLKYIYHYRCEFFIMISERGYALSLDKESLSPYSFLFLSFFEFIPRNPAFGFSISDFKSILKDKTPSRNSWKLMDLIYNFNRYKRIFEGIKGINLNFPDNVSGWLSTYRSYSSIINNTKESIIQKLTKG